MKKKITQKILAVIEFFLILFLIQGVLMIGLRLNKSGNMRIMTQLVQGELNSNILIIGSSRALVHYDCDIIESFTKGKTCFNIGIDGTGLYLNLAYLKAYLKNNIKPDAIIIDVGFFSLIKSADESIYDPAQYIFALNDTDIYRSLVQIDKTIWLNKYVPIYNFIRYGRTLTRRAVSGYFQTLNFLSSEWDTNRRKGYLPENLKWDGSFEKFKSQFPEGVSVQITDKSINSLSEIIKIAKLNNIKLILVYSPEYFEIYPLERNRNEIFDVYRKVSEQNKIPFWDYSKILLTKNRDCFYNSMHMNSKGTREFSRIFGLQLGDYLEK